jgi:hypothetical protein
MAAVCRIAVNAAALIAVFAVDQALAQDLMGLARSLDNLPEKSSVNY